MGYSRKIDLIGELLLSTFLHHQNKLNFMPLAKEEVKFWQQHVVQKFALNWVENKSFIQTNWKLYWPIQYNFRKWQIQKI